jgi:hypothetical protein
LAVAVLMSLVLGCGGGRKGAGSDGGAPIQQVTAFGCFAASGDGWERLENGQPASIIATPALCGGQLISDNVNAFSPEVPPTTITFTRDFVVSDTILQNGIFSLSYRADDAAAVTVNGQSVASCTPPSGNIGACSETCQSATIARSVLVGGGQVNHLKIVLTNLLSVDAGAGNFGWTSLAYAICATAS